MKKNFIFCVLCFPLWLVAQTDSTKLYNGASIDFSMELQAGKPNISVPSSSAAAVAANFGMDFRLGRFLRLGYCVGFSDLMYVNFPVGMYLRARLNKGRNMLWVEGREAYCLAQNSTGDDTDWSTVDNKNGWASSLQIGLERNVGNDTALYFAMGYTHFGLINAVTSNGWAGPTTQTNNFDMNRITARMGFRFGL